MEKINITNLPKSKHAFSVAFGEENECKVISELKIILSNYLEKHTNISLNSFCMNNDLNRTTLRNLLLGETKKYITPEVARKIVCGVNKNQSISAVLNNTRGELGDFLRERFAGIVELDTDFSHGLNLDKLRDKNRRLIFMMAHNKGGTSREEIAKVLDNFALSSLDKLLKESVLFEDDLGKITGPTEYVYLDNEMTKELIQEVNYFIKPSETPHSMLRIIWGRISQEKIAQQKAIMLEADKKIQALYKDEDINGEISFFTMTADSLSQPNITNHKEIK